jgi:hypothetical protein
VSVARAGASEPTGDYSTWNAVSIGLLAAGLVGGALLIAADLSTLVQIKVITVVKERLSGHDQHSWAMALLGLVSLPMAYGAARRRARPAMLGLVVLGAVALLIALFGDLPDTRSTGVIGQRYEEAAAQAGPGFYLETAGGVLLLVAGVGGLLLLGSPRKPATRPASEPG